MSKTIDAGTPIFGALNEELGMPDFDVHDFDVHAFDFLRAEDTTDATSSAPAHGAPAAHGTVDTSDDAGEGKRRKDS